MKTVFNILMVVAVVLLGYLCVKTITTPIKFDEQRAAREEVIINRLCDIRKVQVEYKKQYNQYTGSLDSLVAFLKNGKIATIYKEGELTDQQLEEGLTEKKAVEMGLIRRDTSYVNVAKSLFDENFNVDSIVYVPFGNGAKFEMAAAVLTSQSGVSVPVFEAKTPYNVYLQGMDRQELINLNDVARKLDRYAGLKVGDVNEANNNAGNWE
ncbi:MAG: hypothetical protein E7076_04330 [Bacteroidales bacterium]|jgi:hypothetical protein|nr:hypothetical protein [Bacteroidales bacterium]MBP5135017.1 hypothetical protein [Paludibacteraceae bacterium]MBR6309580.1 hypothetical protein [Paludibacteraceae bacterium]MDD6357605.1 hypothetical protein [Bacteroidales bacterium]